jgi:hypothetical protein
MGCPCCVCVCACVYSTSLHTNISSEVSNSEE